MWLTGRLPPDFKTIANFRKDHGKAIRTSRQFIALCQQLDLFSDAIVAIDGSKFKAVNNRDRNFTSVKLKRRMEEIEASISRRCPGGQALIWRSATIENGMKNHRYWSSNCQTCAFKEQCTPSPQR